MECLGGSTICLRGSEIQGTLNALPRHKLAVLKGNDGERRRTFGPLIGCHFKSSNRKLPFQKLKREANGKSHGVQSRHGTRGVRGGIGIGCAVADFRTASEPGRNADAVEGSALFLHEQELLSAQPVTNVDESKATIVPPAGLSSTPAVLPDVSGYVIKVSAELMGVFKYVEKLKRARIKDLADALWQVAAACVLFSLVRGLAIPLIEIFRASPPAWGKSVMMLTGLDYFAVAYLALKAREPMLQAIGFAVEQSEGLDALEHQEEAVVTMMVELVKLFKRMRNVIIVVAVSQLAQVLYGLCSIKDPNFVANLTAAAKTWVIAPWT